MVSSDRRSEPRPANRISSSGSQQEIVVGGQSAVLAPLHQERHHAQPAVAVVRTAQQVAEPGFTGASQLRERRRLRVTELDLPQLLQPPAAVLGDPAQQLAAQSSPFAGISCRNRQSSGVLSCA